VSKPGQAGLGILAGTFSRIAIKASATVTDAAGPAPSKNY